MTAFRSSVSSTIARFVATRFRRFARRRARTDVDAVLSAARATMRRKKYCVFASTSASRDGDGDGGGIDARVLEPMPTFGDDFVLWFGTSPASRKVAQIRDAPAATVIYQDDAKAACVALVGRAYVVDDLAERRARFRPAWWAFFPDGPEGDDYVLLRFEPYRIEVWDVARGVTPDPFGLRAATLTLRDGRWSATP